VTSEEIDECAYLLLGFMSSTFLSKAMAPRMVVVGGETVDELCQDRCVST